MKKYIVTFEDGGKMMVNAYSYTSTDGVYVFDITGGFFSPYGKVSHVKELM